MNAPQNEHPAEKAIRLLVTSARKMAEAKQPSDPRARAELYAQMLEGILFTSTEASLAATDVLHAEIGMLRAALATATACALATHPSYRN